MTLPMAAKELGFCDILKDILEEVKEVCYNLEKRFGRNLSDTLLEKEIVLQGDRIWV